MKLNASATEHDRFELFALAWQFKHKHVPCSGRGTSAIISNPARPMPPSPTVKDAKRMRKESGASYNPLLLQTTGPEGDQQLGFNPVLNMSAFRQDSNMSSGG